MVKQTKMDKNLYNFTFLIILAFSMSFTFINSVFGKWALMSYLLIMYFGNWWLIENYIFERLFEKLDA